MCLADDKCNAECVEKRIAVDDDRQLALRDRGVGKRQTKLERYAWAVTGKETATVQRRLRCERVGLSGRGKVRKAIHGWRSQTMAHALAKPATRRGAVLSAVASCAAFAESASKLNTSESNEKGKL